MDEQEHEHEQQPLAEVKPKAAKKPKEPTLEQALEVVTEAARKVRGGNSLINKLKRAMGV